MAYLTILNVRFYSEYIGYICVEIGNTVYEYDFEINAYIDSIKKIIDKKNKQEYDIDILFEKVYLLFPEKNEEIYSELKYCFNEYFVFEIEKSINKGMAKKLKSEVQIDFLEFKQAGRYFNIYCNIYIFEKKLRLHFTKTNDSTSLYYSDEDLREWFIFQLKINKTNVLTSNFYVDSLANKEFYGIVGILKEMVSQEFKKTKYYKMFVLYDDNLKNIFKK
jgi:hypothetical protein